ASSLNSPFGLFFLLVAVAPDHGLAWILRVSRVGLRQLTKQKARSLRRDDLSHQAACLAQRMDHGNGLSQPFFKTGHLAPVTPSASRSSTRSATASASTKT